MVTPKGDRVTVHLLGNQGQYLHFILNMCKVSLRVKFNEVLKIKQNVLKLLSSVCMIHIHSRHQRILTEANQCL